MDQTLHHTSCGAEQLALVLRNAHPRAKRRPARTVDQTLQRAGCHLVGRGTRTAVLEPRSDTSEEAAAAPSAHAPGASEHARTPPLGVVAPLDEAAHELLILELA